MIVNVYCCIKKLFDIVTFLFFYHFKYFVFYPSHAWKWPSWRVARNTSSNSSQQVLTRSRNAGSVVIESALSVFASLTQSPLGRAWWHLGGTALTEFIYINAFRSWLLSRLPLSHHQGELDKSWRNCFDSELKFFTINFLFI